MDTQSILTVLGILATTVFGIWAVATAIRFSRAVQLTYAFDSVIALTDDITQNFQDLSISFRGEPVSANLVLLKGYLINTGRRDISRDMVEDQVALTLPDEFEWIQCKVTDSSASLCARADQLSPQRIEFQTGLWKRKEYLHFEALAKVPLVNANTDNLPAETPSTRLRKALSLTHRIANSTSIKRTCVPSAPSKVSSAMASIMRHSILTRIIGVFFVLAGVSFAIAAKASLFASDELGYLVHVDGTDHKAYASVKDEKIRLSDSEGFELELTLQEFTDLAEKRPTIVRRQEKVFGLFGIVYTVMGILILACHVMRSISDRRMLAMIAKEGGA